MDQTTQRRDSLKRTETNFDSSRFSSTFLRLSISVRATKVLQVQTEMMFHVYTVKCFSHYFISHSLFSRLSPMHGPQTGFLIANPQKDFFIYPFILSRCQSVRAPQRWSPHIQALTHACAHAPSFDVHTVMPLCICISHSLFHVPPCVRPNLQTRFLILIHRKISSYLRHDLSPDVGKKDCSRHAQRTHSRALCPCVDSVRPAMVFKVHTAMLQPYASYTAFCHTLPMCMESTKGPS